MVFWLQLYSVHDWGVYWICSVKVPSRWVHISTVCCIKNSIFQLQKLYSCWYPHEPLLIYLKESSWTSPHMPPVSFHTSVTDAALCWAICCLTMFAVTSQRLKKTHWWDLWTLFLQPQRPPMVFVSVWGLPIWVLKQIQDLRRRRKRKSDFSVPFAILAMKKLSQDISDFSN